MSTEKTEGPTPGTAVTVRERLVTQAPVAIWDTADFEQMQRVGVVLARSGLVPESLCTVMEKDPAGKDVKVWLDEQIVAARCVLICNQARLWGADPLNVLQCTSLINGRLMYEGKLVNAIVQHLTGVKLRFELGRWNTDHFESVEDSRGLGEALAIRCFDPEDPMREVSGSVGMWKTNRNNSPWSNVGNWPRQLRYRAVREWARAYEPGAILGILAEGDEEIDFNARDVTPRKSGVMERLSGEQNGDGFNHEHVQREAAPKGRRKKSPVPDEPEEAMHAAPEAAGAPLEEEPAPEAQPEPEAASDDDADAEGLTGLSEAQDVLDAEELQTGTLGPALAAQRAEKEASGEWPKGPDLPETIEPDEEEALPADFQTFVAAIEVAANFPEVKQALAAFFKTPTFQQMPTDQQNRIRYNTWMTLEDRKREGTFTDLPDQATDVSAFRLWVEAQDDAEAIQGTLAVLERQPAFAGKDDAFKDGIRKAAADRVALL